MTTTRIRDEAAAKGQLGNSALSLLRNVLGSELRRFPSVRESDSVEDLVMDFFAEKAPGYVDAVLATADDDAAKRMTHRWVRNWLVDRVRTSPYGALRNRIEKRLQRSPLFRTSEAKHYWCLKGADGVDRVATDDDLIDVAADVHVDVDVGRDGAVVLGQPGQLEELLRVVLELAGRLHIGALTRVCARRFPSVLCSGDVLTGGQSTPLVENVIDMVADEGASRVAADQFADLRDARAIFEKLAPTERIALRFGDDPTEVAKQLGVGRSTAYSRIRHARDRLLELAGDRSRARDVLRDVLSLILDDSSAVPSL